MSQQSHFWVYIKKIEIMTLKKHLHSHISAALFTMAKPWEQPNVRQTDEENVAYTHKRTLFSL